MWLRHANSVSHSGVNFVGNIVINFGVNCGAHHQCG
jgi:hypothetical protein